MAATQKQIEALAKARAAKGNKTNEPKTIAEHSPEFYDGRVWIDALLVAMANKQVVHATHVAECVPVADEALRLYKERF